MFWALRLRPGEDPKEIVRQPPRNDTRNREPERSYTYTLREETRKLDSGNAVKRTESKTWEVIPLAGDTRAEAEATRCAGTQQTAQQESVDDIVNGFDLRIVREEQIDGMPVWVIEGEPQNLFL